jgi:hypothetical protein
MGASHAGRLIGCPTCAGQTRCAGNIFRIIPKGGVHRSIDPADKTGKRGAGDGESDDSWMRGVSATDVGLVRSEQVVFGTQTLIQCLWWRINLNPDKDGRVPCFDDAERCKGESGAGMREQVGGCALQPGEEIAATLQWTPPLRPNAHLAHSTRRRAIYGR